MLKPGTVEMNNGIESAMVKHQGAHMGIIWGMLTASLYCLWSGNLPEHRGFLQDSE